jgi:hypothetical protein
MPQPKITLYIDIVSPFAYIAYYILKVRFPLFIFLEKKRRKGKEDEGGMCTRVRGLTVVTRCRTLRSSRMWKCLTCRYC